MQYLAALRAFQLWRPGVYLTARAWRRHDFEHPNHLFPKRISEGRPIQFRELGDVEEASRVG